jgi:hypothetical protein
MPHDMIDEIQSRKGEKVALFLTFENAAGLILGVLPAFMLSGALPWWLRILIVVAAGAVGVLATLEVGGLAFYERLIWAARGGIAGRATGDRITPEQLVGARAVGRRDRALPIDGPVRAVTMQRAVPGQRPRRSTALPMVQLGVSGPEARNAPLDEDEQQQIATGTNWEPVGTVWQAENGQNGHYGGDAEY